MKHVTESEDIDGTPARFHEDLGLVYIVFVATATLGLVAALLYAVSNKGTETGVIKTLGGAALIAGACAFVGSLIGFLFAIPRSRQGQDTPTPQVSTDGSQRLSDYAANTNLEQISDWLTKILVGISLVQSKELAQHFGRAATALAPLVGNGDVARSVTLALMIYFGLWGFFFAYLITRLWLPKALSRAEREEAVRKKEAEIEAQLGSVATQAYAALYEAPPEGFERAIKLLESYLDKPTAMKTPMLFVYLASAYGQKHAYLLAANRRVEADAIKEKAIAAVEDALRRGPETKGLLMQLYRGADPSENDLVSLQGDGRLEELLGKA